MEKTNTKHSLVLSILSIVLSLVMLTGGTFAWYTDSISSGVNTIVAGNLDMEIEYARQPNSEKPKTTDLTWNKVDNNTELFDTVKYWEPGATEVVYLKVKNTGSLAFKYQLGIQFSKEETADSVVSGEKVKLSELLEIKFIDFGKKSPTVYANRAAARDDNNVLATNLTNKRKNGELYAEKTHLKLSEKYYAVVIYMPTTVGNEANPLIDSTHTTRPSIDIGIVASATQKVHEEDGFGEDYDEQSEFDQLKEEKVSVSHTKGSHTSVLKIGDPHNDAPSIGDVEVTMHSNEENGDMTLTLQRNIGTPSTIPDLAYLESYSFDLKVDNSKFTVQAEMYIGKGLSDVKLYHNGGILGEENAGNYLGENKYSYNSQNGILAFAVRNFSPFTVTYIKKIPGDGYSSDPYIISTAKQMIALSAISNGTATEVQKKIFVKSMGEFPSYQIHKGRKVFRLDEDIILTSEEGFKGISNFSGATFDGNGHTITLDISDNSAGTSGGGIFNSSGAGLIIKNLTVEGSVKLGQTKHAGVFVGLASDNITIENCVNNATLTAGLKDAGTNGNDVVAGGFVGQINQKAGDKSSFKKCTNNGTIVGENQKGLGDCRVAGIVGFAGNATTVTDCENTGDITAFGYESDETTNKSIAAGIGTGSLKYDECRNTGTISALGYNDNNTKYDFVGE